MLSTSQARRTNSKEFIKWAWGVQAGRIPRLDYVVKPGNEAFLNYHDERHQLLMPQNYTLPPQPTNHLTAQPPPGITPTVFNLLEASISRQANAIEKMNSPRKLPRVPERERNKEEGPLHQVPPIHQTTYPIRICLRRQQRANQNGGHLQVFYERHNPMCPQARTEHAVQDNGSG